MNGYIGSSDGTSRKEHRVKKNQSMKEMKENRKFCSECTIGEIIDINRDTLAGVRMTHVPRYEDVRLQLIPSVRQVKQNAKLDSREARGACQIRVIPHDQEPSI